MCDAYGPKSYDVSIVGEKLGNGSYRRVYAYGTDKVIKFPWNTWETPNIEEAEMWKDIEGTPHARFFMPVLDYCQTDGCFLIMGRVEQVAEEVGVRDMPKELRRAVDSCGLDDTHPGNFGFRADGSPVMFDYQY